MASKIPVVCDCFRQFSDDDHFTRESDVRGRLDEGYICPHCGVIVYTRKYEREKKQDE